VAEGVRIARNGSDELRGQQLLKVGGEHARG
jgi:hypothetical protein